MRLGLEWWPLTLSTFHKTLYGGKRAVKKGITEGKTLERWNSSKNLLSLKKRPYSKRLTVTKYTLLTPSIKSSHSIYSFRHRLLEGEERICCLRLLLRAFMVRSSSFFESIEEFFSRFWNFSTCRLERNPREKIEKGVLLTLSHGYAETQETANWNNVQRRNIEWKRHRLGKLRFPQRLKQFYWHVSKWFLRVYLTSPKE